MPVGGCCCSEGIAGLIDRFAPKYMVGNVLSGDTAPTSEVAGFHYFKDPGDGTGIDAALAAMATAGVGADLWIRPGTYTRGVGLKRFNVPADCTVRGAGPGAVTILSNAVDKCIFELSSGCTLERMTLTSAQAGVGGTALVEVPAGGSSRTRLSELVLSVGNFAVVGAQLVAGDFEVASCLFSSKTAQRGMTVEGAGASVAQFDVHDCIFDGVSSAIRFGFTGGTSVRDSRIVNNRFVLGNAVVPIEAGANSDRCIASLNVSRGSGSTLPTDAGTNNSINPGVANIWGP